jgi:hypothetical protein
MNTAAREPYAVRNRAFWTTTLLTLAHTLPPGLIAEIVVLRPALRGCARRGTPGAQEAGGHLQAARPDGASDDAVGRQARIQDAEMFE